MFSKLSAALLAVVLPAFSSIVYQNTNQEGLQDVFADNPGLLAIGDEVALAAGPRSLTAIRTRVATFDTDVTADLRLTLYAVGAGDTVGAQLASSVLPAVSLAAGTSTIVQFSGWSLTLPEQLILMLSLENASSQVLGLEVTSSAGSIGFSDPAFSWWRDGSGFFQHQFQDTPNNYYFEIEASDVTTTLPEPVSLCMTGLGLGALILLGRRS